MIRVTECPVCQANSFSKFLNCKDYTVSHETFQLILCQQCSLVITSPRPEAHELSKYYLSDAYISHANKSANLIDYVYKISRIFTLKWKYNLLTKYANLDKSRTRILDFGCGTGSFLQECEKHKIRVAGIEPSEIARQQAQARIDGHIASDIESLQGTFEVITLWHVLEHVEQLNETIVKLKHRLQENGTMFIAVPNPESPDAKKYQEHWAGYDVPRHLWHFPKRAMEQFLKKHNLKSIAIVPMKLDAYYVSLLSEKYKGDASKLSTITKAILTGWKSNQLARNNTEYSSLIYIARK
jgi:2-polyprenyl-3-methyl-5-hydroxy-6-metoxy-1,4-benzoquinol methylase